MFAIAVQGWVITVLLCVVFVVQAVAIINCSLQRADAFIAIGTLSKGIWLAVLFGTLLFTLLFMAFQPTLAMIAVIGGIVYLVDVRPAIRDIGSNSW